MIFVRSKTWIFALVSVVWILSALGFYNATKDLPTLFLSINAFGVIVATYINLVSSIQKVGSEKHRIEFEKTENTFEYIDRWDSPSLKDVRDFTRNYWLQRQNFSKQDVYDAILNDENLKRSIITLFNFWHQIYLSIKSKRVNEDVLKHSFAHLYVGVCDVFHLWLENHIKSTDINGYNDLQELRRLWS